MTDLSLPPAGPYIDLKGNRGGGPNFRDFGLQPYDDRGAVGIGPDAGLASMDVRIRGGLTREMDRIAREFALNADRIGRYLGGLADDLDGSRRSSGNRRNAGVAMDPMASSVGQGLPAWAAWARSGAIGLGTGAQDPVAMPGPALTGYTPPTPGPPRAAGAGPGAPPPPPGGPGGPNPPHVTQDPYAASPATSGRTETTEEMLDRSGVQVPMDPHAKDERAPFTRDFNGGGYSLKTLRQDVARTVGSKISGWNPGPDLAADEAGIMRHVIDGVPSGPAASAEELASFSRWGKTSGMVKNFVGALGEGKGGMAALQGSLPATGAKALGVAGAAVAIGNELANKAVEQRELNRSWQQVLGGENTEGFRERAGSQVFEWGLKGQMGAGTASELYAGAAGIYGTDRVSRARAQTFGVDMYKKYGMDVADSLALVETAAKQGNEGLNGLKDAIEGVSETARRAGMNVGEAQKLFGQNMEGLTPVAGGGTAASLAGVLTEAQVGLGRQFKGVDFSGMTSDMNMYRMAAMSGMNAADFQAKFSTDTSFAGQQLTGGMRNASLGILKTYGGDGAIEMIRSRVAEVQNSGRGMTDDDWMKIGADLQTQYNITPQMVQQVMGQFGVTGLTPRNAVSFLAQTTDDSQFDFEKKVDDAEAALGERKRLTIGNDDLGATQGGGRNSDIAKLRKELGGAQIGGKGDTGFFADKDDRARNLYLNQLIDGDTTTNPVLEALIKDFEGARRFKVKTKDGKSKVVTTDDLIRDYGDQAFQGDVEIVRGTVNGAGPGATLEEALGLGTENTDAATTSDKKKGQGGKDFEGDWAGKDEYQTGTTGRVEIVLSSKVSRYFDVQTSGNAYTDESRYNGTAPDSGRPSSQAPDGGD